jgi:MFS family permease
MGLTDYGLLRNFNGQLAFSVAILMVSQVNYGMDLAAFSTTQAMSAFERQFGVYDPHTETWRIEPYFLSLLNSLTYVGQVAGVLLSGVITRRWGRRASLWVMCFWAYLSAILLVTAQHKEQMLIGRVLNYIYLGQEVATIPVMQAELCPSNIRGFVVSTYQLGIMVRASSFLLCSGRENSSHLALWC